jgi:hypothetical protein
MLSPIDAVAHCGDEQDLRRCAVANNANGWWPCRHSTRNSRIKNSKCPSAP